MAGLIPISFSFIYYVHHGFCLYHYEEHEENEEINRIISLFMFNDRIQTFTLVLAFPCFFVAFTFRFGGFSPLRNARGEK